MAWPGSPKRPRSLFPKPLRRWLSPHLSLCDIERLLMESKTHFQIDFSTLPIDAIHRYLTQFDIVPDIEPMATTAFDPPPPSTLLRHRGHGSNSASPVPQPLPPTPANRPRRELSASANRRRSSRLLEDDRAPPVAPVLSDVAEVHRTLAHVVERHFRDHAVKEVDTLASFMCAVKAKGESFVHRYLSPCPPLRALSARPMGRWLICASVLP